MKILKTILVGVLGISLFVIGMSCNNSSPVSNDNNSNNNNNTTNGTVTDACGNVYHTVTIGTQEWTVENLRPTKYNDGTAIITSGTSPTGTWTDATPKLGSFIVVMKIVHPINCNSS